METEITKRRIEWNGMSTGGSKGCKVREAGRAKCRPSLEHRIKSIGGAATHDIYID
jgi:hypothetical protein